MSDSPVTAAKIVQIFAEVGGLSVFIFALVAQIKQFGIKGTALTGSAFGVGLVFGGAYRYFVYNPVSPADWFWLVVFGLAGGLIATGAYKGIEDATGAKAIKEAISKNTSITPVTGTLESFTIPLARWEQTVPQVRPTPPPDEPYVDEQ